MKSHYNSVHNYTKHLREQACTLIVCSKCLRQDSVLMKTKEVATNRFFAARGGSCLVTLPYLTLSANFKLQHETYLVGDDWQLH